MSADHGTEGQDLPCLQDRGHHFVSPRSKAKSEAEWLAVLASMWHWKYNMILSVKIKRR